jgi:hypothetical protein
MPRRTKLVPEVGRIYRCAATPSSYILVTRVSETFRQVAGWGDAHGHTASHKVVVDWKRLRNTKRSGPFSVISKERALDTAERRA